MDDARPRATIAGIMMLSVGTWLLLLSLALGLLPLILGTERCISSGLPPGEASWNVRTELTFIPYGATCVFESPTTGATVHTGPNPIWTGAIVAGAVGALSGASVLVSTTRSATRVESLDELGRYSR
ncbi:hypothetical protein [Microbacterium luteum]|uniref:hypothetical protein n=1 Tax=Microbacterium TaxID=33882 RepID=UPI00188841B4|nr:hypothetical protein [Microbacterium luteum]